MFDAALGSVMKKGGGGSGASTALDNLASVAINTSLISDTDNTDDLGSATKRWATIYGVAGDFSGAADAIGASIDATTGLRLGSGQVLNFSSTTAFSGSADVGLKRQSAGQLRITNGSTGNGELWCARILDENQSFNAAPLVGFKLDSVYFLGWTAGSGANQALDTTLRRVGAGVSGTGGVSATTVGGFQPAQSANGCTLQILTISESLTLSTSGTTTDTAADLLPANALILSVMGRITTTITTATSWQIGDPTTAGRFTAANATMTANTTDTGRVHATTGVASATTGLWQGAAAKVRITTVGTPGAGVIRLTTTYILLTPPTS